MVLKSKENYEKTRHVKKNNKSEKYFLPGERNTRYHENILSRNKKSQKNTFIFICLS